VRHELSYSLPILDVGSTRHLHDAVKHRFLLKNGST